MEVRIRNLRVEDSIMPKFSREWIEDVIIIPDNPLLPFNRRDAQIARNWSKASPSRDIFDDRQLAGS